MNKFIVLLSRLDQLKIMIFANILLLPFACDVVLNHPDDLIKDINLEELASTYFEDFTFTQDTIETFFDKEIKLVKTDSIGKVLLLIRLNIYNSTSTCQSEVENYLNTISIVMNEGDYEGISVGEEFWWWTPSDDIDNITNVIFTRNNIAFDLVASNFNNNLVDLALNIDKDINTRADYITFE